MIDLIYKEDCCGCEACVQVCPRDSIVLKQDDEGFMYPFVNLETCTDCGLCEKVCPVLNQCADDDVDIKSYAVVNNDVDVLNTSSSGGFFTALANFTIDKGGVVFGAVFDDDFSVKHTWTTSVQGVEEMRGSKYLQSRIGDSFSKVKEFLKLGKLVLFSGTPCQISALNLFLRRKYDNLITIDFICHGVPSPLVWQKYLCGMKYDVSKVNFRDKTRGWENYSLRVEDKSFTKSRDFPLEDGVNSLYSLFPLSSKFNYFMKLFLSDVILRPSCYNCRSKGRIESTIKIADFWGIKNVCSDLWRNDGVSLVIIPKKNLPLLEKLEKHLEMTEVDFNEAIKYNKSYYKSVKQPSNRDYIMKVIFERSIPAAIRAMVNENLFKKFVKRVGKRLGYEFVSNKKHPM